MKIVYKKTVKEKIIELLECTYDQGGCDLLNKIEYLELSSEDFNQYLGENEVDRLAILIGEIIMQSFIITKDKNQCRRNNWIAVRVDLRVANQ